METFFNNLIDLFLHFDAYEPFQRFCIIGTFIVGMGAIYATISALYKVALKIFQFIVTVAMTILVVAIIGFVVWLVFNMVILGNIPV